MILNIKKITRGAHIIRTVFFKYPWKFIGMAVLGLLAGFSGSLGIGTVIPLFALLTNRVGEEANSISLAVQRVFSFLHLPFTPAYLIVAIAGLFIIKALVQFAAKYFNEATGAHFEEELRNDLYQKTLETKWLHAMNQKAGYLERILLFDVQQCANIIMQLNAGLLLLASLATYAFVAFNISVSITLITLGFGVVIFIVFKPLFYRTRKLAASIGETYREASHHVTEHMLGAKLAKISGIEKAIRNQASIFFHRLRNARVTTALYSNAATGAIEPL